MPEEPRMAGDHLLRLSVMICAVVLTLTGLWAARAVMTPVAFALFIIALVWPLQWRLRAMIPQVIAVLVSAAVALLAVSVGGYLVVWSFGGIAQWIIANAARLQSLYMHAAELLEARASMPPSCSPNRSTCCGWCRFFVRSAAVFRVFSAFQS